MNIHPTKYQLPELTAHVVALLERRREAFEQWDEKAEQVLQAEADAALSEAEKSFRELADDAAYWAKVTRTLKTVAIPRYFRLAKEQHALEKNGFGAWRGGDLVSRVVYAVSGLVVAGIVFRTAIPDYLEPLPLAFFLGGPLIPDFQAWRGRRRYEKALAKLVDDMGQEQREAGEYQPLGIHDAAPVAEVGEGEVSAERVKVKP